MATTRSDLALFVGTVLGTVCLLHWRKREKPENESYSDLQRALADRSALNATERICTVTADNEPIAGGSLRADMRLHNLWHRATYVLIQHKPSHLEHHPDHAQDEEGDESNTFVLVQRRSRRKDYGPGKLDPVPGGVVEVDEDPLHNAVREMQEEMGMTDLNLRRLFTFPYQDDRVRVWGTLFEGTYRGALHDLTLQKAEVDEVLRLSLQQIWDWMESRPDDFMPDAIYALQLYRQRRSDVRVNRRLLHGYSSSNLDRYQLRPRPQALFFDCDDCLYFDGWTTANRLTAKIDAWCVSAGLRSGQAYELYKQYGTALRGLLAEGYLEDSEAAIGEFLETVHDIGVDQSLSRDDDLRAMLLRLDPTLPRYIFTASVRHHAEQCLQALGIADLFVDIVDCKACGLETKHSAHSFRVAMERAGVNNPEACLLLDDSVTNLAAARKMGWRSVLVGRVGRDCGKPIDASEHAELEIDRIHHMEEVLPELFVA